MSSAHTGAADRAQRGVDDWEPGASAEKEYLSEFVRLPGMWEADEDCLAMRPTGFCEHGHVQLGSRGSCGSRDCPLHWTQWQAEAAENAVARLAAYRYAQEGIGRRMLHVVASPPQDGRWPTGKMWDMRSTAYEHVREHDGRGGLTVPHAYKPDEEAKAAFAAAVEAGQFDGSKGIWRFLRERTADWDALEEHLEVAPHYHMLAPWRDLDGEKIKEELSDEWVIHNIRSLSAFYLFEEEVAPIHQLDENNKIASTAAEVVQEGFEDMARLTMYLLSHSAVQLSVGEDIAARNTVTYFGDVHPNAFDPEEELEQHEWERVQKLAAEAIGREPEEAVDEEGTEEPERECAREECEAAVQPLGQLDEYLSDVREYEGWFRGLEFEQQCEIWGLHMWNGDKPPPGGETAAFDGDGEKHELPPEGFDRSPDTPAAIQTDREEVIEWLRRFGRKRLYKKPGYAPPEGADIAQMGV